jgi:PKD repeat protein
LVGYITCGSTRTVGLDKSIASGSFIDIDVSADPQIPTEAVAAIVEVWAVSAPSAYGLRPQDSTDGTFYDTVGTGSNYDIVPLDTGKTFEGRVSNAAIDFFILGYIVPSINANFSGTPLTGGYPLTVTFTDTSTGATSWLWNFGDGSTSTLQNPTHTYMTEGLYTVSLTINGGVDVETKTNYITVTDADLVPDMTDVNVPTPTIISASINGTTSYRAFDDSQTTYWNCTFPTGTAFRNLNVNFGSGNLKQVTSYTLKPRVLYPEVMPYNWELWGSNNNFSDYVVLDSRTGETFTEGQCREFSFTNTSGYRYYRLRITAVNPGYTNAYIADMQLKGTAWSPPPNYGTVDVTLPALQENGGVSGMNDLTSNLTPIFNSDGSGTNDCDAALPAWVCNAGGYWMATSRGEGWLPAYQLAATHYQIINEIAATLPLYTLTGTIEPALGVAATFPLFTLDGMVLVGEVGVMDTTFPFLTINAETADNLAMLADIMLPMLVGSGILLTGTLSTATNILPSLTCSGLLIRVSPTTSTAYLVLPMPRLDAYANIVSIESYRVFAINLKNLGISEYTNYGFNSICKFDGQYYGMNSGGIYILEGDTDAGSPIEAVIETGRDDFKMRNVKHLADAFITMRGDGEYILGFITEDGQLYEYPIATEMLEAGTIKVDGGKGGCSQYWGIKFRNTNGAKFEIEALELNAEALRRRRR